jgi:hypothetical protein
MKYEKGQSGNKNGRPKGVSNKITSEIREKYLHLIEDNFHLLEDDIKSMRSVDRVKAIIELSRFILPTLKATDFTLLNTNTEKFTAIEIELK